MDEFDRTWKLSIPRSAAAWSEGLGEDELQDALDDEIANQSWELVADYTGDSGGWPEDESIEVTSVEAEAERLIVGVTVYFSEVTPTGCDNIRHHDSRSRDVVLTLHRGKTEADVELSQADWDVADYNSAGDGM